MSIMTIICYNEIIACLYKEDHPEYNSDASLVVMRWKGVMG